MKKAITILIIVIILGVGGYFLYQSMMGNTNSKEELTTTPQTTVATSTTQNTQQNKDTSVIGTSVENREIKAYHFGSGEKELLFIGGIHGGYEWNTALVAYELVDYLKANPSAIPKNIKVTVIPVLNPDGLYKVVGTADNFTPAQVSSSESVQVSGRFNANNVDLNRNFDCDWQRTGVWQDQPVNGGNSVFSEPESQAIKNYVEKNKPAAIVAWYSAVGGVFSSNCHNDILPETVALTNIYAKASGYPAHESYDFYEITGDMINWFAKNNIPAISVLLTNHTDTEWTKNQAGVDAILKHFAH